MTRSELLEEAASKLGRPIRPHHLQYAVRMGYVTPSERRPDGWNLYSRKSVNDLVQFMRQRSRSGLSQTN